MKPIANYFMCFLLTGLMSVTALAQSTPPNQNEPRPLNDRLVSDRLDTDWKSRNPGFTSQPFRWYDDGDGYYGTYSNNNQDFMTRYDRSGNYVQTLSKKEWNDNVPVALRNSFLESPYKSQQVTSYWEVSDPGKKGYYLVFKDDHGKVSRVKADENGLISNDRMQTSNRAPKDTTNPMQTRQSTSTDTTKTTGENAMVLDTTSWPASSRLAVKEITDKYGKPDGVTAEELIWLNKGVWKKIAVTKSESKHSFPVEHTDMMTTTISHKVPQDKMDDLGKFDGSVTFDRTQGTLSARCDQEGNNFLALNLAHDIIAGKKTVDQARTAFGDIVKQKMNGANPAYMQKLTFKPDLNVGDPDKNITGLTRDDVVNGIKKTAGNIKQN